MFKVIGGVVIGVFIGAMALEILNRKRPHLIRDIEDKAEHAARAFVSAFREGYTDKHGSLAS